MKTVFPPIRAAELVCGVQKASPDCRYRRTKHCVQADCDDGTLLYHTLTGELLLLEAEREWDTCRAELIQRRFLVPETFDEPAYADKFLRVAGLLLAGQTKKTGVCTFTVFTTTGCNARCPYCFEAGVRAVTMSRQTAEDVADYLLRVSEGGKLSLRWFGGEPLLNPAAIDTICARLREHGAVYTSTMISNGYYLDAAAVEKAVSLWNLRAVQVTLDGRAETYNRVKAYAEGGDAYGRVLENIERARAAGIRVHVRLNVTNDNIPELTALVDELAARFAGKDGLAVYPSLIGDFHGADGRFSAVNRDAERFIALRDRIRTLGLGDVAPLSRDLPLNGCRADNPACEVILPDGSLSRCDHAVFDDVCGSIYSDVRDTARIDAWKQRVRSPECFDCPLYPRCYTLKNCALVGAHCPRQIRTLRIDALQHQIRAAYRQEKENAR